METLARIFEIVNNRISVPIAALCSILLFFPEKYLRYMELKNFVSENKSFIWMLFIFSFLLYLYEKIKKLIPIFKAYSDKIKSQKK